MRLIGSSKSTANGLVMALVASLLGTGLAVVGAASPANAAACGSGSGSFPSGSGTSLDPYLVSSSADLIRISSQSGSWGSNLHYLQTTNIDLGGCEWTPIGNPSLLFTGSYDGGGHTIEGLSVNQNLALSTTPSAAKGVGLFGNVTATMISHLRVKGQLVSRSLYAGGIVGLASAPSTITLVRSEVTVQVDPNTQGHSRTGGIAGQFHGVISYSSFEGEIFALKSGATRNFSGGLVGSLGGSVLHSYARASQKGVSTDTGGIVSIKSGSTSIVKSYSAGSGANAGVAFESMTSTTNTFWDTEVETSTTIDRAGGGVTGRTSLQMKDVETFSAGVNRWDIIQGWTAFSISAPAAIWGICSQVNDGYPFLLWEYNTNPCAPAPTAEPSPPATSPGPSITMPSAAVSDVSLSSGAMPNQTLVQVRLTKTPTSLEQFFIVVRLLDLQGVLIRELRVPVEPSTSFVEIPVDKRMGQFNVVALTSNAAGATAAVSFDPQTVKQPNIRKATENAPKRLTGKSLNRDVVFTADSAALSPQMQRTLRQAARLAKASDSRVAVTGFAAASPKGTKFEKRLAERRALRVANFLRKQGLENWIYFHGVNSLKGSDFPGQPRRVEIRVLK